MSFRQKIKTSKFVLSCVFCAGYALYSAYALYYYLTYRSPLGIALLCMIGVALFLSCVITFLSYRINLRNKPRPKLHRFVKMAKYAVQLLCSALAFGFIFSAVHADNVVSVVMTCISVPFLLWGLFVNAVSEYFERKFAAGFGKRVFIPSRPQDAEGNELDLDEVIAAVDGTEQFDEKKPY